MKRLRTLSIARPEALMRKLERSAWGEFYWRGVLQRKSLERRLRPFRRLIASVPRVEFVSVPEPDGEPAIEIAARMVY
jgi:hypothetical protein